MSRRLARRMGAASVAALCAAFLLPPFAQAAEPAMTPKRRSETLERLRDKYPDFRFRLKPDAGPDPSMAETFYEGPTLADAELIEAALPVDPALRRLHAGHLLRHI